MHRHEKIMTKICKKRLAVLKMKTIKLRYLLIALLITLLLAYILMNYLWSGHKTKGHISSLKLQNVIVHLDLKGSPPKLSYLKTLLPMLKSLGATGFLMEYEDMFPYEGKLVNLSASNRYDGSELKEFLTEAVKSGFEIIPLVQTFGHMEHVLKLAEFQYLREIPFYPDSICPSQKQSQDLIKEMLEQVITFHNEIAPLKQFHIGCDEVYHINGCDKCRSQLVPSMQLFVSHVETVKDMIKELSPNIDVLMWDDMLRSINVSEWDSIKIQSLKDIEPVYWDYKSKISLSHVSLLKYHSRFKEIWTASAFKGADGRTATLPNMKNRFLNHYSWISSIRGYKFGGTKVTFNFKGIILTGWSRYSHMDPPCELLPSSIPSLVVNLLLIQRFKEGIPHDYKFNYVDDFFGTFLLERFNKHLQCGTSASVEYFDNNQCTFEGNELYKVQKVLENVVRKVTTAYYDINRGFSIIEYYANTNNVNRNMAGPNMAWCNETLVELLQTEKQMADELSKYFDRSFVNEYVNFKSNNAKRILYKLLKGLQRSVNVKTWPRRPYNI